MTDRKKFIMLILFSIFFPLVIGSVCVLVNGNKISKAKPSGKIILVDNKNYSFEMDMENFISYVLMAQMDESEPEELLKAKSVIIRTYILYKMKDKAQIAASDLGMEYRNYGELKNSRFQDFCRENIKSPKGMAAYFTGIGSYKIYNEKNKKIKRIVDKTKGKIIKKQGETILPLFHNISNGKTRLGEEILGKEYSYLKSVICQNDIKEKEYLCTRYLTVNEFKKKLSANGIVVFKDGKEILKNIKEKKEIINLITVEKDKEGYALKIRMGDTVVLADDFSKALGLNSTDMSIEEYEKGIRITTKGNGHGFGMSISYARYLAGHGKPWQEILSTFYDGKIVEY
ncbi:SpoIID/LytB domain-containing protein [Eubacterium ventriosum]|uniref:SpoIID/LytB domain-containing protein n=1 Tax=Eubacterium ventriosum TaxID=39496 RepID=UPI00189E7106|nr:SpoIID/LytB domain-containing protein [Eubacterium ventriosum]